MGVSETDFTSEGIGPLRRSALGRRLSGLRARLSVARLDLALAGGADPWSSTELMIRAARLGSLEERCAVAAGLVALVDTAEAHKPGFSTGIPVRHRLVVDYAEELLALARRLRDAEPVKVNVVAELALLVRDGRSPVYAGGRHPTELAAITARSLRAVLLD
jgi:hypothetical protein